VDLDDELRKLFADERLDVPVRPEADRVVVSGARQVRRRRAGVIFGGGVLTVATVLLVGTAFGVSGDAPSRTPLAAADSSGLTTTPPAPSSTTATATPTTTDNPPAAATTLTATHATTTTSTTTTIVTTTKAAPPASPLAFGPSTAGQLTLGMSADAAVATGLIKPNAQPVNKAGCQGFDYTGLPNPPYHYSVLISPRYGLVRVGGIANAETSEGIYVGSPEADVLLAYPDTAKPHGAVGEYVTPVPGNPNAHYWIIMTDQVVTDLRLELAVQDCYR
jgi:hypothetical protein